MTSSADPVPRPGLRERKKARTRSTIRSVAIRLFVERGFAATTVEQIAEAAEVSPSTFFRYFPTKEAVIITDEADPVIAAAFRNQPAGLNPVRALRNASRESLRHLTEQEREQERLRQIVVLRTPELQSAFLASFAENIDWIADVIAEREGASRGDLRIRTLAGAITGVIMAITMEYWFGVDDPQPQPVDRVAERVDAALALLEAGVGA